MKGKRMLIGILLLSISIFTSACTPVTQDDPVTDDTNSNLEEDIKQKDIKIEELEKRIKDLEEEMRVSEEDEDKDKDDDKHLLNTVLEVTGALKEEDMEKLKSYIHPEKGVRFSPYQYVDLEEDVSLKRDEISDAYKDSKTYIWGDYDGKGDPIELSFKDYYQEFVYDQDFLNPQIIGIDTIVSSGNEIDNVEEAYPQGQFVELFFQGFDEQYAGIDWKSLKLVFEKNEDKWFLVGVIHGQWTV